LGNAHKLKVIGHPFGKVITFEGNPSLLWAIITLGKFCKKNKNLGMVITPPPLLGDASITSSYVIL